MTDHDDHDNADRPEHSDEELDELVERWALEQGTDLDPDRFRELASQVVEDARADPKLGRLVLDLEAHGATLFVKGCPDNWLELRLGYPEDPERWPKAAGRSVPLGRFPLSRVLARAQG